MDKQNRAERCRPTSFVVLEGVDGSGKTTVAKLLSDDPNIEVTECPPQPFSSIKQEVLENVSVMARFVYFMAGNIQVAARAKGILPEKNLVCVRYIFSTLAYHSALEDVSITSLQPMVQVLNEWLKLPDIVIFLGVSRLVQKHRLTSRLDDELQTKLASSEVFQSRLLEAYDNVRKLFNVRWVDLDTSNLEPADVASRIKRML